MESNFSALAQRFAALLPLVPKAALPFYRELCDSVNITALRAKEVCYLLLLIFILLALLLLLLLYIVGILLLLLLLFHIIINNNNNYVLFM